MNLGAKDTITWLSPLQKDDFKEYSDKEFIKELGLENDLELDIHSFWPKGGPVWDALGKTSRGDSILVEAKSHIGELNSPPTGAKEPSLSIIKQRLNETKEFLGSKSPADWSQCFYQYANRISHLYYLRVLNNLPTYLIFLYFVNDNEMNGPTSIEEWKRAIDLVHAHLVFGHNKLSKYVIDAFVDVNEIS